MGIFRRAAVLLKERFIAAGAMLKGLTQVGSRVAVGLRWALSQGTPGNWANDHREEANHFTGWNYVAIHALATQAAQADVAVYDDANDVLSERKSLRKSLRQRGISKAYVEAATDSQPLTASNPLVRLLKRPNPTQSGASFRYESVVQLLLTGTCMIWKVKNSLGRTLERYVIPIAATTPLPPSVSLPRGGWIIQPGMWRLATSIDPQGFTEMGAMRYAIGGVIPAEDVLVVRMPHPIWKDDGYSALAAGKLFIDTAEQLDQARWAHLKNGGDPSLAVMLPKEWNGTQEDLDAQKNAFNAEYSGTMNTGKTLFATGGATVTKLTTTAKEMDYVEAFTQYREAVMALHQTPGVACGIFPPGGTYGALAATLKAWVALRVQPLLNWFAEEETEQQAPEFGDSLIVEYTAQAVDDPELLEKQLTNDNLMGTRTKGEVRKLRGLPPFGDERDEETIGTNLQKGPPAPESVPGKEILPGQRNGSPFDAPDPADFADGAAKRFALYGKDHHRLNGHAKSENRKLRDAIAEAARATDRAPSPAQKESGNYRKGKFRVHGLTISIENPKDSTRSGTAADGTEWSVKMPAHYGYIKKTQSEADGDHIDVFVGPDPESELIFVIDQARADGSFDEHKVLMGFTSEDDARTAYLAAYAPGWKGLMSITPMTLGQFLDWLENGDTAVPIAPPHLSQAMKSAVAAALAAVESDAEARAILKSLGA